MDLTPYVGPAFRLLRERHSLSQEQLALNAGLDRTYVSGIERSCRNPSLKSMQRMASELSVSLDEVFSLARELAEQGQDVPAQKRVRAKR
ncbi:helix-turn-helix transcriptional regulator [Dyella sp. KULCS107]|uniref:helix-turn-helix transcriptional regulator n=1 Tax=Dyella sp. KULCS107 TaxID=3422216 RepID=UPI003D6F0770